MHQTFIKTYTNSLTWIFSLFLLISCYSAPNPPQEGLQPQFQGFVPGLILAVPTLELPDPLNETATIDSAVLLADGVPTSLEKQVLRAFQNQPNIRGYSFQAVQKGFQEQQFSLLEAFQTRLAQIEQEKEQSHSVKNPCLNGKNFTDFYIFCVATDPQWQDLLHQFSRKFFHGDTALFVVITNGFIKQHPKRNAGAQPVPDLFLSFSVLLLDTNSGDLIWANSAAGSLKVNGRPLPESWDMLIGNLLAQDFFVDFPGRIIQ